MSGVVGDRPSVYSLESRLRQLRVPTTVVVGDRDHWCTRVSEFIVKTIPGAELAIIRDAGHMTNLEQPEQFNRALEGLLARSPS
jgi:3-oxoadipate enol-lactonase